MLRELQPVLCKLARLRDEKRGLPIETCRGQCLRPKENFQSLSFHCFEPKCDKKHEESCYRKFGKKGVVVEEHFREQVAVSELCKSFEGMAILPKCHGTALPTLCPLGEHWDISGSREDRASFEALFDETAQLLALLHMEADDRHIMDYVDPRILYGPRIMKILELAMKELWRADLFGHTYNNIASHLRILAEELILEGLKRLTDAAERSNPQIPCKDVEKFSDKVLEITRLQSELSFRGELEIAAFQEPCLLVQQFASSSGSHAHTGHAHFELAGNLGNNYIIICRAIVHACALYSKFAVNCSADRDRLSVESLNKEEFLGVYLPYLKTRTLKLPNVLTNFYGICAICWERPITHGFLHGSTVHWSACEDCASRSIECLRSPEFNAGCCPQCKQPVDRVVEVFKQEAPGEDAGRAGPSNTQAPERRAGPRQGMQEQAQERPGTQTSVGSSTHSMGKLGDHAEAVDLKQQVQQQNLGAEHPDTLTSMRNLAHSLGQLGEHAAAIELLHEVVEVPGKVLGANHPDTLISLACTLGQQGKHVESAWVQHYVTQQVQEAVVQVCHRKEGFARLARQLEQQLAEKDAQNAEDHGRRELAAQVLQSAAARARQWEEKGARLAQQLEQQLAEEEVLSTETHGHRQGAAQALRNAAAQARQQEEEDGRLAKQLEQQLAFEVAQEAEAQSRRQAAAQALQKAVVHARQGEEENARLSRQLQQLAEENVRNAEAFGYREGADQALQKPVDQAHQRKEEDARLEQQLKEQAPSTSAKLEQPGTQTSLSSLAGRLQTLVKPAEAAMLLQDVLELQHLSPEHPDRLAGMGSLARSLGQLGKHDEAAEMQQQVLQLQRKVLGPEHTDTLASMGSLAHSLRELGKHAEAVEMWQQLLELQRKVLGPEHPDTLTSMGRLARSLGELGKHAEAVEMKQQVLEQQWKMLGPEHTDTLTSMGSLAHSLGELGKHASAAEMQRQELKHSASAAVPASSSASKKTGMGQEHMQAENERLQAETAVPTPSSASSEALVESECVQGDEQSHAETAVPASLASSKLRPELERGRAENEQLQGKRDSILQTAQLPLELLSAAKQTQGQHTPTLPGMVEHVSSLDIPTARTLASSVYSPAGMSLSPTDGERIAIACEGNPLKICVVASAIGSGRIDLEGGLEAAKRDSCFVDLLSGALSEYLNDLVQLSFFSDAFSTDDVSMMMGVSEREASSMLRELHARQLVQRQGLHSWRAQTALKAAAREAIGMEQAEKCQARFVAFMTIQMTEIASLPAGLPLAWLVHNHQDVCTALEALDHSTWAREALIKHTLAYEVGMLSNMLQCVGLDHLLTQAWHALCVESFTNVLATTPIQWHGLLQEDVQGSNSPSSSAPFPLSVNAGSSTPVLYQPENLKVYMVGRQAEAERLQGLLDQGHTVMITGSSGLGKSTLTRHVLKQMKASSATVVLASATSASDVLTTICRAFGVNTAEEADFVSSGVLEGESKEAEIGGFLDWLDSLSKGPDESQIQDARIERLLSRLQDLCKSSQLNVVVLESCEVPLADGDGIQMLQGLIGKLKTSGLPLKLLLQYDTMPGQAAVALHGVVGLDLAPLNSLSAEDLAAGILSSKGMQSCLEGQQQAVAACGGHPLKIKMLAAQVAAGKATFQDLIQAAQSSSCCAQLLGSLPSDLQQKLLLLSSFGSAFSTEEAGMLLKADKGEASQLLKVLQGQQLLDTIHVGAFGDVWCIHPMIRQACQEAAGQERTEAIRVKFVELMASQLVQHSVMPAGVSMKWLSWRHADLSLIFRATGQHKHALDAFFKQVLLGGMSRLKNLLFDADLDLLVPPPAQNLQILCPASSHQLPPLEAPSSAAGDYSFQGPWVRLCNLEPNWVDDLLEQLIPSLGWRGPLPIAKAVQENGKKVYILTCKTEGQAKALHRALAGGESPQFPYCVSWLEVDSQKPKFFSKCPPPSHIDCMKFLEGHLGGSGCIFKASINAGKGVYLSEECCPFRHPRDCANLVCEAWIKNQRCDAGSKCKKLHPARVLVEFLKGKFPESQPGPSPKP